MKSNNRHKEFLPHPSIRHAQGTPPWILKRAGLESSGQIPTSSYWKTKRINKMLTKKNIFSKFSDFWKNLIWDFSIFFDFLTIFDNFWQFLTIFLLLFLPFQPFLTAFNRIECCWPLLTVVDRFWPVLSIFFLNFDHFWPSWPNLDIYHTRTSGHMRHFSNQVSSFLCEESWNIHFSRWLLFMVLGVKIPV